MTTPTDPQAAAAAAERVQAFLDARTTYRKSAGAPRASYMDADEVARQITDATPSTSRTWYGNVRILNESDLVALLAERARLVAELEQVSSGALHDEYGILDDGGGDRQARTEPIPMPVGNAAMGIELRAKGIFAPGSRRPARLMQRKVTDWVEIGPDVQPDDILPGYSERRTARA